MPLCCCSFTAANGCQPCLQLSCCTRLWLWQQSMCLEQPMVPIYLMVLQLQLLYVQHAEICPAADLASRQKCRANACCKHTMGFQLPLSKMHTTRG